MNNEVFFAEQGLTATSANHIANMAKELIQSIETKLNNITLYDTSVSIIGSNEQTSLQEGINISQLEEIPNLLTQVAEAKSLIAWLREAIKAKEQLARDLQDMRLDAYCELMGITLEEEPKEVPALTEEEYLNSLSIKDRNRYFSLETTCAVLGKYIHPDGTYSSARKDLKNKLSKKHAISGSGRDAIIYTYTPTVSSESADALFFQLQQSHREAQAELNGMKNKMQETISKDTIDKHSEYLDAYNKWAAEYNKISEECKLYKQNKIIEINKLKITIPNSLKAIYGKIQLLNK